MQYVSAPTTDMHIGHIMKKHGTVLLITKEKLMKNFFKNNGLSIVFFLLFVISLVAQAITGLKEHNEEMLEEGGQQLDMAQYLTSGHFLQATFENWESEFLQMALFVTLVPFKKYYHKCLAHQKNISCWMGIRYD